MSISSSLDELRKLLLQNGYRSGVFNYNVNDVLNRQENRSKQPTITVPKKEVLLILPYLGLQSRTLTLNKWRLASINSKAALTFKLFFAVPDPREGPERPPLFLDQTEAQRAGKNFWPPPTPSSLISGSGWPGSPYLKVWSSHCIILSFFFPPRTDYFSRKKNFLWAKFGWNRR